MKYGIRENLIGPDASLEQKFQRAAHLGFDGIELITREDPRMHGMMALEDAGRSELVRLCAHDDLLISSLSLATWREANCLTTDLEEWQRGKQHLIEAMAAANALDCDGILLPHFGPMEPKLDDPRLAENCRGLRECAFAAEDPELLLCVECTVDEETMQGIVEMADHPQVGIYFDIGNLTAQGFDTADQLRALGEGVKMIHIKEAGAPLLGEGNVDMPAIADAVRDIHYDGWLVFETAPTDDPLAAAEHNLAELRKYL